MDAYPVVVVGGGIAGLSCAVALSDAGIPVQLFEGSRNLGGRAQSVMDETSGETVDIGPHVLTRDHRNMLALLERLGTAREVCWQPERFITLVHDGQPIAMRNYRLPAPLHFLPNFFRVKSLSTADIVSARRVLWRVMQMSETDVLALDARVAEDVLRELGVTETFIDWFWRTVCVAIMNVPLEQCSAGSLFRFLKMMSGRSDFHFGFPMVGLADLFVPGSMDVIREAGGAVHTGTSIRRVVVEGGRATAIETEAGERTNASQCIVAVPPDALARLLPVDAPVVRGLGDFRPSPYISIYLWFSRKLTQERFWARTWSPGNLNTDFYDLSNIRTRTRAGSLIASNCIFSAAHADKDDDTLVEETLRELAEFLPGARREHLEHARVHRIDMAILAPEPGFERRRPPTQTAVDGLFLAGDWIQTAVPESMESAVRAGFLAAEAVAADRGVTLRCALPLLPMGGIAGWLWRRRNGMRDQQGEEGQA